MSIRPHASLTGPGGGQGTVQLRCTLTRFSDYLLDKAVSNGKAVPTQGEEGYASAASQAPQLAETAAAVEVAVSGMGRCAEAECWLALCLCKKWSALPQVVLLVYLTFGPAGNA